MLDYELTYASPNMSDRTGSCGGSFYAASGILTSPNDKSSEECIYMISLQNGSYVNISIISIEIDCTFHIEMREGISEESPLMGKWCGNVSEVPGFMVTSQNHLRMR